MKLSVERLEEIKKSRLTVYQRSSSLINVSSQITADEVSKLFFIYDKEFFNGQITQKVVELSLKKQKFIVNPEIQFLATKRTSGYGSISGYYFDRVRNEKNQYVYQKNFFIDISPNLFDVIFDITQGKGLPGAAGIGCDEKFKCFMLVMEHEIIHLLMSLWSYDSPKRVNENKNLFGSHGLLFNCMLQTYFGHTQKNHNLALEGIYVEPTLELDHYTPEETGVGFSNWDASCYLDSLIVMMLETKSNYWRKSIFDWTLEKDKTYSFESKNPGLSQEIRNVMLEDYKSTHEQGEDALECRNLRELLSIQDPLMKTSSGRWKMYESGSAYATFVQLFPSLLIDIPVKIIRPSINEEESITYKSEAAFTYSDFMLEPTPENKDDYKRILWSECQSPILVFTHQAAPEIKVFDSLEDEKKLKYKKVRAFGPRIIDNKYKLVGVVVLHGSISSKGGGGHYTCYFLAKNGKWYHYNDMEPSFTLIGDVEDLPRNGVWQKSSTRLPTMYFYVLDKPKKAGLKKEVILPTPKKVVFQKEKKEAFKGENMDYVRVDRPDHGVIFIIQFKNPSKKHEILKKIREFLGEGTETIMDENKSAFRLSDKISGDKVQSILGQFETKSPVKGINIILKNKAFTIYDYSDKSVAVVGHGVSKYKEELGRFGLESLNLKFGLGNGFIISKTKLKELQNFLGL